MREKRGPVTQRELASRTGLDQATISRIERGLVSVSDDVKVKIAAALQSPVGELFGWPDATQCTDESR
ncbi:MAG TPA: helix-turn-helix transcriptional regulator [Acidimicrobiales bacterium]|nr:helix-turn-helix transcriptional regulator [Acidimicrobiales bacterium]